MLAQTIDLPLHRGIQGYERAIVGAYAPMRVAPGAGGTPHRWAVAGARKGGIGFTRIIAEGAIQASVALQRRPEEGEILLTYVARGAFQFRQHGQLAHCEAGSLVLMDASSPLEASQEQLADLLSIRIPLTLLRAQVTHLHRRCTQPIPVRPGATAVLAEMMQCAWRERDALTPESAAALPKLLGGLIEHVFPVRPGQRATRELRQSAIARIIDDELRNPALTPALIAARLGISTSYLYTLARDSRAGVRERIIAARLEAARRALASPRWREATVMEVALEFGFQDAAHFSRRFKARFGHSPGACRLQGSLS